MTTQQTSWQRSVLRLAAAICALIIVLTARARLLSPAGTPRHFARAFIGCALVLLLINAGLSLLTPEGQVIQALAGRPASTP
jgi:hypothetical protein